jgi:hypothetical protein
VALLGVETRRHNLELLDGFSGRHVRHLAPERGVIGHTVERELAGL